MPKAVATATSVVIAGAALAGCSHEPVQPTSTPVVTTSATPAAPTTSKSPSSTSADGKGQGGKQRRVGGKVTEVKASALTVEAKPAPVRVTWNDTTTFRVRAAVDRSVLKEGLCVSITPVKGGEGEAEIINVIGATCGMGATPSPSSKSSNSAKAPKERDATRPTVGLIKELGPESVAVQPVNLSSQHGQDLIKVKTTDKTQYSAPKDSTSSSLVAGKCVSVTGKGDDAGMIAATMITVSDPVEDKCPSNWRGTK